ncbi:MAG: glucosidase, partial [Myxococcales bacterium]
MLDELQGHLQQADGTAWMALYSQVMLQIAIELAMEDRTYGEMAMKFFEHFIWIASAMTHIGGGVQMWDDEDGFFYDALCTPDRGSTRLKVRSMVGLLPLAAATVFTGKVR